MKVSSFATVVSGFIASAVLAAAMTAAPPASAADIYQDGRPHAGSPYDDPRYRDMYGAPSPPNLKYVDQTAPRVYEKDEEEETVVYTDRPRDYLAPMRPHRYIEVRPPAVPACVPRELVRRQLLDDGWRDFHDLDFRGPFAIVHAYRPDGRLFRLKVERCSGQVVKARPLDADVDAYREEYPERRRFSRFDERRY